LKKIVFRPITDASAVVLTVSPFDVFAIASSFTLPSPVGLDFLRKGIGKRRITALRLGFIDSFIKKVPCFCKFWAPVTEKTGSIKRNVINKGVKFFSYNSLYYITIKIKVSVYKTL
jgi:hypothetical protein